jgi:N-acetylneuraminic acid mutarotase
MHDRASDRPLQLVISAGPVLPVSTAGHAGGLVEGVPVIAGGSTWSDDKTTKRWLHESFLLRNGEWVRGPDLPHPLADPAYAWDARGLFVAGGVEGKTPVKDVWMLQSIAADATWAPLAKLPVAVDGASGAILGDRFYVVGGFMEKEASARFFSLNLKQPQDSWKELAPLPATPRAFSAFVAVDGALYLFGGFSSQPYQKENTVFDDAYRYNPSGNTWTRLNDFHFAGYGWTAIALPDHRILFVGRVPEIGKTTRELWVVDLRTFEITPAGELPSATCCLPAIPFQKGGWLLPGGEPDTNRSRSKTTFVIQTHKSTDQK